MRHLKSLPLGCLLGLMGIPAAAAVMGGQQRLNWAADDARRVAALETDGTRLEGEHVTLWFPRSLARRDAEALLKRLDTGVAGLWRRVGVHEWQSVPKGGRAPYLHEAAHELLASTRGAEAPAGTSVQRPLWFTEGLPDYLARLVSADVGTPEESGPFDTSSR